MNCYTGKGDKGETCIFDCKFDKYDERLEAIGTIDELNAFLGAAASFSADENVKRIIHEIENDLFSIGAELAMMNAKTNFGEVKVGIAAKHVYFLEACIDKIGEQLPKQTKFIIPSGTKAAMLINAARTVSRRAERALVKLDRTTKINPELLKYVNRLSSLLHVLSRFENNSNSVTEKNPEYHYSK